MEKRRLEVLFSLPHIKYSFSLSLSLSIYLSFSSISLARSCPPRRTPAPSWRATFSWAASPDHGRTARAFPRGAREGEGEKRSCTDETRHLLSEGEGYYVSCCLLHYAWCYSLYLFFICLFMHSLSLPQPGTPPDWCDRHPHSPRKSTSSSWTKKDLLKDWAGKQRMNEGISY